MAELRVALNDIAPSGRTLTVNEPAFWDERLRECGMECRIVEPLIGEVMLLPQEDGCLVRGQLVGAVMLVCDRCAEDARVNINTRFDSFEPFPPSAFDIPNEEAFDADADAFVIRLKDGTPELDLTGLLWEEFVLALPVKPLCSPDCKGLCPTCGKNRNEGTCSCIQDEGDPRLAVLRGLQLKK